MGTICTIQTDHTKWHVIETPHRLKTTHEPLFNIEYGSYSDDPEGSVPLTTLMRQSILDGIRNGKYTVTGVVAEGELAVWDENGKYISKCASSIY